MIIRDVVADRIIEDYFNHKTTMVEMHRLLIDILGSQKKAFMYLVENEERIKRGE